MNRAFAYRRVCFETASAMHAGSGESDPVQDMPIQTDVNGLPIIAATSIAGVLRHLYGEGAEDLFGNQQYGSRLCFSDAAMLDENGTAVVGIQPGKLSGYLEQVKRLRRRDHCAITEQGTARKNGKFDRSILIAGVRFVVEFCIAADDCAQAKADADRLVELFLRPDFRLGGGTRNGFGRIRVLRVAGREYDLADTASRRAFLARSASLADDPSEPELPPPETAEGTVRKIRLKPEDFWLFSDGTGLGDLDIRPKFEDRVCWPSGKPEIRSVCVIPATSVKGALAHRTAYHYNRKIGRFADKMSPEELTAVNPAVATLFGWAKGAKGKDDPGRVGRIIISDMYIENDREKAFNHVSIDRFTGGALYGALFTEMVQFGGEFCLEIVIEPPASGESEDSKIREAFEEALADLRAGRLPLGGGVMRGLGAMRGEEVSK